MKEKRLLQGCQYVFSSLDCFFNIRGGVRCADIPKSPSDNPDPPVVHSRYKASKFPFVVLECFAEIIYSFRISETDMEQWTGTLHKNLMAGFLRSLPYTVHQCITQCKHPGIRIFFL